MPPLRKLQLRESQFLDSQSAESQPWRASEPPLGLSEVTWRRARADPRVARLVKLVWFRLAELECAGHDPGALAALRYTLALHQPTRRGTCRACPMAVVASRMVAPPLAVRHLAPGPRGTVR